jgi:hypothetical protein
MTELPAPERIAVIWSPEGRVDLRAIDRETAMQILHCVDRYLASRSGDVKKLKPRRAPASASAVATTACSSIRKTTLLSRSPAFVTAAKPTADLCQRQTRMRFRLLPEVVLDCLELRFAPCSSL